MDLAPFLETILNNPPLTFDGSRPLKAWAKYCLQDRGLKVVYAQNADFAIEQTGQKTYVNVSENPVEAESDVLWIIRDRATGKVTVLPPA